MLLAYSIQTNFYLAVCALVQILIVSMPRVHPAAACLAPLLLATPFLIPLELLVARWLTSGTAFIYFASSLAVHFIEGNDAKKVRTEPWIRYMLRFCNLKYVTGPSCGRWALKRVAGTMLMLFLSNVLILEHIACKHETLPFVWQYVHWYVTGFGLFLLINSLANCQLTLWACVAGVEMEDMFNRPYLATSLRDFWGRRWNILISNVFKRIVYLPLGGRNNRVVAYSAVFFASAVYHEYLNFYSGLTPLHNLHFFVVMGLATTGSTMAWVRIGPWLDRMQVPRRVVSVFSWAGTLVVLLSVAPSFFKPYDDAEFFEEAVAVLPWHSVSVYPGPILLCPRGSN